MKVYRVAHESARNLGFPAGPYAYGGSIPEDVSDRLDAMRWDHNNDRHPGPSWDPTLRTIRESERCGFDSRGALDGWFDGWTRVLAECGFRVYVYDVPDWACRIGEHGQTLFVAEEAVELSTEPFVWTAEQLELPA